MNTSFCPPISLAATFAFGFDPVNSTGEFKVSRTPENGGDIVFKNRAEIEASFASESLHPGDLKAAVTPMMVATLEKLAAAIKADGEATKAAKTLKAIQKKLAKKK
jgi:tyrosyl-tRNA synthetase